MNVCDVLIEWLCMMIVKGVFVWRCEDIVCLMVEDVDVLFKVSSSFWLARYFFLVGQDIICFVG